jgi:Ca-activated chloride channel family protein
MVAPWVLLTLLAVVATSGVSAGFVYLVRRACSGDVRARLMAAPDVANAFESLARSWLETEPAVNDRCAGVDVDSRDTAAVIQQFASGWDTKAGPPPDVWVPESTAWARRASAAPLAAPILPADQPAVVRSPAVIAMPKPMAEALGWPPTRPSWQDLTQGRHKAASGWGGAGNPSWGEFRLGMTDPLRSTAGLHALMAVLDSNADGEISGDESANLTKLRSVQKVYEPTVDGILANLRREDGKGGDAALRYVSAFPALESEVVAYNLGNPRVPLVAVYPRGGTADADHPYLILKASWAEAAKQEVALRFFDFLRGPVGRSRLQALGFRDPAGVGAGSGGSAPVDTPRAALSAASIKRSLEMWTALTRVTNLLLVVDVSGSMGDPVPGLAKSRLGLVRAAAQATIAMLSDDSHVGLWLYATRLGGTRDHKEAVPAGRLGDPAEGAASRREALAVALDQMSAGGNAALYDTVVNAYRQVGANFREGANNLVVVVTDGGNDDDTGGLTLKQTIDAVGTADSGRRVPVVTIGLGPDADVEVLKQISRASGTFSSYPVGLDADLGSLFLTAVLGGA